MVPKTSRNSLAVLRRVRNLLMRRVDRATAKEVKNADGWSPGEVEVLLSTAQRYEPRFHGALATLFYTGVRRGELLALKWEDVDFDGFRIQVRRS